MRDESHLDDMRSAIRGDFERLAERRGGQELMREPEPEPEPDPEPEPAPVSEPEPVPESEAAEPVGVAEGEEPDLPGDLPGDLPETLPEDLPEALAGEPRKSFLDRLLGR